MTAYRDLVVSAADQNSRPFVFSHGLDPEQTLIIKFDEYGSLNYHLARLVEGDSPKAFLYSIANFPIWVKP